ncbi:MAG: ABC transporter permease [Planctomycetes bacterium]|nr:ABC transporter permease [Planctomycetota bacterium]
MVTRIARLTRVELMKLVRHPFFWISLALLVAATLLGAWGQTVFSGAKETVWRPHNAIQLFAYGAKLGVKMASFILVIFGAMLFAGEFDRGTIKILLTRPVTRTELFLAKGVTGFLLALFLFALVLALSFGYGCAHGELGPVWDTENYLTQSSEAQLADHAWRAVRLSAPAIVAAVFLGIAVSTLVESSGFAVAIALTLFIGVDLALGFLGTHAARYVFSLYPSYALDVLRGYAEGKSTMWRPELVRHTYWSVPLASAGASSLLGYAVFRLRNITA